jgi:hypothetical protein
MDVENVDPLFISQSGGDGDSPLNPGGVNEANEGNNQSTTSGFFALSTNTKIIVGSVGACIGGLCFGMLCLLFVRRRSPNHNKHSRFDDYEVEVGHETSSAMGSKYAISPQPTLSLSPSPDEKRKQPRPPLPYYDEADPPAPRYFFPGDPPGVARAESLPNEIGFEPSRRKRSHRGSSKSKQAPLNRVNSLLDDNSTVESRSSLKRPPPRSERPPPHRSRTDPIPVHRSPSQWSNDWSFVDEYGNRSEASGSDTGCEWTKPENFACGEVIPGGAGNLFHRPCSSPNCKICEQRRERGLRDEEYNWLKLLLPPSPEKIPAFDPDRPCLCSDTVEL